MERPIIFNDAMSLAIIEGRKTETRRPLKPQHPDVYVGPYGEEGDTLWVRETWRVDEVAAFREFRCDAACLPVVLSASVGIADVKRWSNKLRFGRWAPSIHMPRWAARTVLDVLEVRAERLQSMTEEDARAEGFASLAAFIETWYAIYPTMSMRYNPWVRVVRFKRQGGA